MYFVTFHHCVQILSLRNKPQSNISRCLKQTPIIICKCHFLTFGCSQQHCCKSIQRVKMIYSTWNGLRKVSSIASLPYSVKSWNKTDKTKWVQMWNCILKKDQQEWMLYILWERIHSEFGFNSISFTRFMFLLQENAYRQILICIMSDYALVSTLDSLTCKCCRSSSCTFCEML